MSVFRAGLPARHGILDLSPRLLRNRITGWAAMVGNGSSTLGVES